MILSSMILSSILINLLFNVLIGKKMEKRVNPWKIFMDERPEVVKAYQEMMKHVNKNDVLDKKTMALIYVGIYSTIREAGALRHFVSEALEAGATKEEVETAALLAFTTGVSSAELSLPIILNLVEKSQHK
jgi:alkylhydroperoxidase/carboxymuconolactone decarboxylase family protein YurZ